MNRAGWLVLAALTGAHLCLMASPILAQANLRIELTAGSDSAASEVVQIPLAMIDPSWISARVHYGTSGPAAVLADRLASGRYGFLYHGDFNEDGRRDVALVGVYEDEEGEAGQFVLIITERSPGLWEEDFLGQAATGGGVGFLQSNPKGPAWWACIDCTTHLPITWTGERYESREVRPPIHGPAEVPEDFNYLIDYEVDPHVIAVVNARCADAIAPTSDGGGCRVQSIFDAADGGYYFDHYTLSIPELPQRDGKRMRPEELLRYIRLNLASFVDSSVIRFRPYGAADSARWSSDSPWASILSVEFWRDGQEKLTDGAVLVAAADDYQLVFTTLWTERYGSNPLSGTREIVLIPHGRSGAILVVSGVLRTTNAMDRQLGGSVWKAIETGWGGLPNRVSAFVNANDGRTAGGRVHHGWGAWRR